MNKTSICRIKTFILQLKMFCFALIALHVLLRLTFPKYIMTYLLKMPRNLCNFAGLELLLKFTVVALSETKLTNLCNHVKLTTKQESLGRANYAHQQFHIHL